MSKLISDDQIRRHEIAIPFSLVDHADVDFFTDLFAIKRAVGIWLNVSCAIFGIISVLEIKCQIFFTVMFFL